MEDDFLLEDDLARPADALPELRPWRVLIVDDEPDVHAVTRFALRSVSYKGRALELLSAHSAAEGYAVLAREPDIALVFLDVVMETEQAGLHLAQDIRNKLGNHLVRIVLRTGQPGQAPEESVIVDYDINDYKAKSELTAQKMFTTVIASLRAYDGLLAIERNRQGLSKILEGSANLYEIRSLREFASGVLNQIGAILDVGADGVLCVLSDERTGDGPQTRVIAATGNYATLGEQETLPDDHEWSGLIAKAFAEKNSQYHPAVDVLFVHTKQGHQFAVVVTPPWPLNELQRSLLAVFCDRISAAFDNLHLYGQLKQAQEATVVALADLAESRDARHRRPCDAGLPAHASHCRGAARARQVQRRADARIHVHGGHGQHPARRRQGGHARPRAAQARPARQPGARRHAPPRRRGRTRADARGRHAARPELPVLRRPDRRRPPRACGWQRLPAWLEGRRHSAGRAHRRGGGRV